MTLSVVVPAYNSANHIGQCLHDIFNSAPIGTEVLVVDDGSHDATSAIAEAMGASVVRHSSNRGLPQARYTGIYQAKNEIIVFVDSDVCVEEKSLTIIENFFQCHKECTALTGRLSKKTPQGGFLSTYKNQYMYHTFSQLPDRVDFLYGSIFALRAEVAKEIPKEVFGSVFHAEDTALGQWLHSQGHEIALLKKLEVVHLKSYTFSSFVATSFYIPKQWALLLVRSFDIKILFRRALQSDSVFVHASPSQVISLVLAPICLGAGVLGFFLNWGFIFLLPLLLLWGKYNFSFHRQLFEELGFLFTIKGVFLTFLDHLLKFAGVFSGFLTGLMGFNKEK